MADSGTAITQEEYEALADFRYALRQFLHVSEEAARADGLTPQQYQGMLAIRGFRGPAPMTVGDLAERLQVLPHSAVALANRLTGKGLVVRDPGREDARQVYLSLTPRGSALLEKQAHVRREELCRLEPDLKDLCARLRGEAPTGADG